MIEELKRALRCAALRNIQDLYAEKRLTAARTRQVASHLASCSGCARVFQESGVLKVVPAAAPAAFKRALAKALEENTPARVPRTEFWLRLPRPDDVPVFAGAAACACLLFFLAAAGPGVPFQGDGPTPTTEGLP